MDEFITRQNFNKLNSSEIIKNTQYNFYDRALSLLIALQIFGIYGGALQPIRVFIILLIPAAALYLTRSHIIGYFRYEARYFAVFLIYAIVAGLFVNDQVAAIKELSYLAVNFSSIFVIIYLASNAINPKKSIINGWVLLFIFSIPIAFIEIFFDYHVPISVLKSDEIAGGIGESRRSASVTFGNYNAYNVILVYTLPFISAWLLIRKRFWAQFFGWFIILLLFFIVVTNASRGSLVCISVTFIVFLFHYLKSGIRGRYFFVSALSVVVAFIVIKYADAIFTLIAYRFSEFGVQDNNRSALIYNSIELFFKSYCLGVGTGNFQSAMSYYSNLPIIAPHNFFLEIAVQYGLFIFIGFLILLVRLYKRTTKEKNRPFRFIVFISLLIYPLASVINSGYIEGISIWVQLGSLFIIGDPRFSIAKKSIR